MVPNLTSSPKKLTFAQLVKNDPSFKVPEILLQCSKELIIDPHPEPIESSSSSPTQFF
jgi:hypothetical protein